MIWATFLIKVFNIPKARQRWKWLSNKDYQWRSYAFLKKIIRLAFLSILWQKWKITFVTKSKHLDKQHHSCQRVKKVRRRMQRPHLLPSPSPSQGGEYAFVPSDMQDKHCSTEICPHSLKENLTRWCFTPPNPRDSIWLIFHLPKRHQFLPPLPKMPRRSR